MRARGIRFEIRSPRFGRWRSRGRSQVSPGAGSGTGTTVAVRWCSHPPHHHIPREDSMCLRSLLIAVLVGVAPIPTVVEGQSGTWALDVGYSAQGGNQSLVAVANPESRMTGADRGGFHLRGSFERRVAAAAGWRIEGFYNRLTSDNNTFAVVNGETLPAARSDQSFGLFALGVVHTSRAAHGSPYFLLGGGPMVSRLHRNSPPGKHDGLHPHRPRLRGHRWCRDCLPSPRPHAPERNTVCAERERGPGGGVPSPECRRAILRNL